MAPDGRLGLLGAEDPDEVDVRALPSGRVRHVARTWSASAEPSRGTRFDGSTGPPGCRSRVLPLGRAAGRGRGHVVEFLYVEPLVTDELSTFLPTSSWKPKERERRLQPVVEAGGRWAFGRGPGRPWLHCHGEPPGRGGDRPAGHVEPRPYRDRSLVVRVRRRAGAPGGALAAPARPLLATLSGPRGD